MRLITRHRFVSCISEAVLFAAVASALSLSLPAYGGGAFWGLGAASDYEATNQDSLSPPFALSADGSTLIGVTQTAPRSYSTAYYYWTAQGGLNQTTTLPYAISNDGSRILGTSGDRWDTFSSWPLHITPTICYLGGSPLSYLPHPESNLAVARAIAGDGTVAGFADNGSNPFIYTDGISVGISSANVVVWTRDSQGNYSSAHTIGAGLALGISGNGQVVFGHDDSGAAVRWVKQGGVWSAPQSLGFSYHNWFGQSVAEWPQMAASTDGSIIAATRDYSTAVRWANGSLTTLSLLPGTNSSNAYGISGDGSIIVGTCSFNSLGVTTYAVPFIWDPVNGTRNLQQVLINDYGMASTLADWTLYSASCISADGLTIAGDGIHNGVFEAWVVKLPASVVPVAGACYWNSPADGAFVDSAAWAPCAPQGADHAIFDVAGQYMVSLPSSFAGNYGVERIIVRQGSVTLQLHNGQLAASGSHVTGHDASLMVAAGTGTTASLTICPEASSSTTSSHLGRITLGNGLVVGTGAGSNGTLTFDGRYGHTATPSLIANVSGPVTIGGDGGVGSLNVLNGAALNTGVGGAAEATVLGTLRVAYDYDAAQSSASAGGPFSPMWNHTGGVSIGDNSTDYANACLLVQGSRGYFRSGLLTPDQAAVSIAGHLLVNNPAAANALGNYALVVSDGASLNTLSATIDNASVLITGNRTLSAFDGTATQQIAVPSQWTVLGALTIGQTSTNWSTGLTVASGASLTAGSLQIAAEPASVGTLAVSQQSWDPTAHVHVTGDMAIGGKINGATVVAGGWGRLYLDPNSSFCVDGALTVARGEVHLNSGAVLQAAKVIVGPESYIVTADTPTTIRGNVINSGRITARGDALTITGDLSNTTDSGLLSFWGDGTIHVQGGFTQDPLAHIEFYTRSSPIMNVDGRVQLDGNVSAVVYSTPVGPVPIIHFSDATSEFKVRSINAGGPGVPANSVPVLYRTADTWGLLFEERRSYFASSLSASDLASAMPGWTGSGSGAVTLGTNYSGSPVVHLTSPTGDPVYYASPSFTFPETLEINLQYGFVDPGKLVILLHDDATGTDTELDTIVYDQNYLYFSSGYNKTLDIGGLAGHTGELVFALSSVGDPTWDIVSLTVTGSPAPTPEPGALGLLAIGASALAKRPRRRCPIG